jgi:hypothetical protein
MNGGRGGEGEQARFLWTIRASLFPLTRKKY